MYSSSRVLEVRKEKRMPVLKLKGRSINQGEADKETIKKSLDKILHKNRNEILDTLDDYRFFKFNLTDLELELYESGSQVFQSQSRKQHPVFYILTRNTLSEIISE